MKYCPVCLEDMVRDVRDRDTLSYVHKVPRETLFEGAIYHNACYTIGVRPELILHSSIEWRINYRKHYC